jgi:hypothetical protein
MKTLPVGFGAPSLIVAFLMNGDGSDVTNLSNNTPLCSW